MRNWKDFISYRPSMWLDTLEVLLVRFDKQWFAILLIEIL